jgi:hypothetical protein
MMRNRSCRRNGKHGLIPTHAETENGPVTMVDGLQKDGLVDAYDNNAMGVCADYVLLNIF